MSDSCSSAGGSFANDPVGYLMAAKQQALSSQVGISVLAVSQQATKQEGNAMVELIDAAARLGKELGKGNQFDALA